MAHLIGPHPTLFEPGDRMTREEFLERWERMPELKKAELIDGVVYLPHPAPFSHAKFEGQCSLVLTVCAARTPGCEFLPNATWMMLESAPQPDVALRILPEYGGRSARADKYVAGGRRRQLAPRAACRRRHL